MLRSPLNRLRQQIRLLPRLRSKSRQIGSRKAGNAGLSFCAIRARWALRHRPGLIEPPGSLYEADMSIWDPLGDFIARVSSSASSGLADVLEAVRTVFSGDPDL